MTTEQNSNLTEHHKLAHDYAWNWFSYHAQQRLALFNISLIVLAALSAAFISAFSQQWYQSAAVASLLSSFFSLAFLRLDKRNSDLTKHAETYLRAGTETILAPMVGDSIRLTQKADNNKNRNLYTFGQITRTIYYGWTFLGIAATLLAGFVMPNYDSGSKKSGVEACHSSAPAPLNQ